MEFYNLYNNQKNSNYITKKSKEFQDSYIGLLLNERYKVKNNKNYGPIKFGDRKRD